MDEMEFQRALLEGSRAQVEADRHRRQCPNSESGHYFLLKCVLDEGHEGRHKGSEGETWRREC